MKKIRLFVSSPSDVSAERRRVDNVIKRIQHDYEAIEFEIIRWEESFYTAQSTFQEQIPSSADADIVLCILWKRLGSPLPQQYQRKDGSSRTGTEYEFETAMEAALTTEMPDILVYRCTSEISFSADHVEQEQAELQTLENFWHRWIQNEKGHFTAGFKPFENTDEFEKQLEKDLRAWLKRRFHNVVWPESKGSPYRGLDVFEEEHAPIYFGRRRAINEVRARLIANEQRDGVGFLLIIGASGAGKSSLVRAGLIPSIKEINPIEGISGWRTLVLRPTELGANLISGLCNLLCDVNVLPELLKGDYEQPDELATLWSNNQKSAAKPIVAALKRWAKVITQQEKMSTTADTRLLIVIDQFEELFQFDTDQQIVFLNVIENLAQSGKVWIVATMRSDFYPQLFSLPELMRLKDASRQYDLNIPRQNELQDIITGPATAAGLSFEQNKYGEGLEQQLIEDADGNPAALPLLEFTLERLYQEHDRDDKQLTFKAYENLGGLQGALTQTAEDAFSKIKNQFKDNIDLIFARVMRELVSIDDHGTATKRVAELDSFTDNEDDTLLINTLLENRLLTSYIATTNNNHQEKAAVNITHEALILHWERIQHWLKQDKELLQVRERVTQDCQRWENESKRKDLLTTAGKRLEDIRYLKSSQLKVDNTTSDFIDASLSRAKKLHKRKRRLQVTFSVVSALAAIFGAVTLNSLDELKAMKYEINVKESENFVSSLKSTGLIAEAEYVKATIYKKQNNNIEAFNSHFKAINRAREVALLRQGELAHKSTKNDPDWFVNTSRESVWHIDNLIKENQLTDKDSVYPLVSNNKKLVFISTKEDDKQTSILFNASNKKAIAGPFSTDKNYSPLKFKLAAFSQNNKVLAIVENKVKNATKDYNNRGYSRELKNIILVNTETGEIKNNKLLDVKDVEEIHFLDDFRVAILHKDKSGLNMISIWDTRNNLEFNKLNPAIQPNKRRINQFHVISDDTVLLDDRYIWKKIIGKWREIGRLKATRPFNNNLNNNNPILTENGFMTISNEYDSWLPDFILDYYVSIADENIFNSSSSFRPNIKVNSILAISKINGANINTEYRAIPLANKYRVNDSLGYINHTLLLNQSLDGEMLSFITVTADLKDKAMYTYHHEFPLVENKKTTPPILIDTAVLMTGPNFYTGMVKLNKKTIIYSTMLGDIVRNDIKENSKMKWGRAEAHISGLIDLEDNILLTTKSGAYLVPKDTITGTQTNNNTERLNIEKNIFKKYALTYKKGKVWPSVFIDKDSEKLTMTYKDDIKSANTTVRLQDKETKEINKYFADSTSKITTNGYIHTLNVKNNKTIKFKPANIIKSRQIVFDNKDHEKTFNNSSHAIPSSLARHPSLNIVVTGSWEGAAHVFSTNKVIKHISTAKHTNNSPIHKIKWNSLGNQLATADRMGVVNLWDVNIKNNAARLTHKVQLTHDSGVTAVSYSNDSQWLVTATDTDKLYFWNSEGLTLGKPIELKGIDIKDVVINEDNWWITITAKDGAAYTIEAGDRFIPNKIITYLDLMTRNELFKHKILKSPIKDKDYILKYYRNPPTSDRTFWTTLMNSLFSCYATEKCQNNTSLAKYLISNINNNQPSEQL